MSEDTQRYKTHKARAAGGKQMKKTITDKKKRGLDLEPNRGNNYKAFIGRTTGSHKSRMEMKSMEKKESQLHLPNSDRTMSDLLRDPPLLVAVVGPPGSGKTTLIRSMTKFYSHKNIRDVSGPITVVAGRYRRLTFMECPNDTTAMTDLAKIADLVIMVIDGEFGFEMETFEFITIAQVHGFPRVIGVISHLDKLKTSKQLKRTKRVMRHRFWHEVSSGAKMLCLAPLLHGQYRSTDVLKLHRILISADMKVQSWRNTHSCVFLDRHEDITNPDLVAQNPNMNRTIAFYGYIRGHPVRQDQKMHIPGLGDFDIKHISVQEDPCVPLEKGAANKQSRMRHLSTKHRKMYAPYCDAAAVGFDDQAVYVHEDADRENVIRSGEGLEKLRELQRVTQPIDGRLQSEGLEVLAGTRQRRPVKFSNDEEDGKIVDEALTGKKGKHAAAADDDDKSSEWSDADDINDRLKTDFGHLNALPENDDDYPEGDADEEDTLRPRPSNAPDSTRIHKIVGPNWHDEPYRTALKTLFVTGGYAPTVGQAADGEEGGDAAVDPNADDDDAESYGSKGYESVDENEEETQLERALQDEEADATTRKVKKGAKKAAAAASATTKKAAASTDKKKKKSKKDAEFDEGDDAAPEGEDVSAPVDDDVQDLLDHFLMRKLGVTSDNLQSIRDEETNLRSIGVEPQNDGGEDDDLLGKPKAKKTPGALAGLSHAGSAQSGKAGVADREAEESDYIKKKMAKKQAFDVGYDSTKGKNNTTGHYNFLLEQEAEKKEHLKKTLSFVGEDIEKRVALVGYFSGLYVRMVFENVPVDFVQNFDPKRPMFAGGINAGEDEKAIIYARVKNHRWFPKILKAQDPLVMSIGWRRVQVQPLFAVEDPNGRHRYLKYTPRHMHCFCAFYAPVVPPNTGFVVLPTIDQTVKSFRIPATGYTVATDASSTIVKKLKLTGVPETIQKTTVFVKGMFTSDLEAAKFIGAKVKSVSGLRGIIKKAIKSKDGIVRCTFEDKLLKSDIVFLRAWTPVEPPRYCVDVANMLVKGGRWQGMRPMSQLRKAFDVPLQRKPDSEYKDIERRPDRPNDDRVLMSRTMRIALPFEMKEQYIPIVRSTELQERVRQAATVAPEPSEQRKLALLSVFREKAAEMDTKRRAAKAVRREKTMREKAKDDEEQERKLKKARKETARKVEFRSQHKSRTGKSGPPSS